MQIASGSLLIAHPVHAHRENREHVVYITESTSASTMGLTLNNLSTYNLQVIMDQKGIDWYGPSELYTGGEYNAHALIMLHSNEWFSSNTIDVNNNLALSSDGVMIEKMEMGNTPEWYRLFVGCKGWEPAELGHELKGKNPKWLLLAKPSQVLIELSDENLWDNAVAEYSQDVFDSYF